MVFFVLYYGVTIVKCSKQVKYPQGTLPFIAFSNGLKQRTPLLIPVINNGLTAAGRGWLANGKTAENEVNGKQSATGAL